jgi:aspartate kinase
MIVMKFGGSSLATPDSIRRVVSILRSEADRRPVVVTSAMGDTTDHLVELLSAAHKANSYAAWKLQEAIKTQHFAACDELLHGDAHSTINRYLRDVFRDLHVRMLEVCEGERSFNKELQGWTLSLGEQLSSRLLSAILEEHCGETTHLDARKLILTNNDFLDAKPHYWESYARIRWAIPAASRNQFVVLGGFIGSNEDGLTTTLGRGGSDLTASIVGAAINADEIQLWKDVDGMLTCDPRLLPSAYQVKHLSHEEARELAQAGATVLHPETMGPSLRRHIPVVIRNTFCPESEGTRIEVGTAGGANSIKSIAAKTDTTLLEIRAANGVQDAESLLAFSRESTPGASVLFASEQVVYVAVQENSRIPDGKLSSNGCLEVRVRSHQAILTLVGQVASKAIVANKLNVALQGISSFIIPFGDCGCSVRVAVPQDQFKRCLELLHHAFFASADPQLFAAQSPAPEQEAAFDYVTPKAMKRPRSFTFSTGLLRTN